MNILRHIAFYLSLMVLMGHDLIPHTHEDEANDIEDVALPPVHNGIELNLSHILGHFQHNSSSNTLVYTVAAEKKVHVDKYVPYPLNVLVLVEDGTCWYTNLKKQRFRVADSFYDQLVLTPYPHRGPPSATLA